MVACDQIDWHENLHLRVTRAMVSIACHLQRQDGWHHVSCEERG
jgi:hypothetical protein